MQKIFAITCATAFFFCVTLLGLLCLSILFALFSAVRADDLPSLTMGTLAINSLYLGCLATALASPLGVAAAIYLEEYASPGFYRSLFRGNIGNLTQVPLVIWGLLGLAVVVPLLGVSQVALSVLIALILVPRICNSTRAALQSVPQATRNTSYALGASHWETLRRQVLPRIGGTIGRSVLLAVVQALGFAVPMLVMFGDTVNSNEARILSVSAYKTAALRFSAHDESAACIIVLLGLITVLALLQQLVVRIRSRRTEASLS